MRTLALALIGLVLTGCTAFMDGLCSHDNRAGGYCDAYNVQRAATPPIAVPSSSLRDAVDYATQNPRGGTICTPVRDAGSTTGYSVVCR